MLTAWVDAAAVKLREKWGSEEDKQAAQNFSDAGVQARLQEEGDAIRAEIGSLESLREKYAALH